MEEKKTTKEMTLRDVLVSDLYVVYMRNVMEAEVARQEKAAASARAQGARLRRTPLDSLRDKGAWEPLQMVEYYGNILSKTLAGFSATERAYITMVGLEAFKRCFAKIQEMEKEKEENATKRK